MAASSETRANNNSMVVSSTHKVKSKTVTVISSALNQNGKKTPKYITRKNRRKSSTHKTNDADHDSSLRKTLDDVKQVKVKKKSHIPSRKSKNKVLLKPSKTQVRQVAEDIKPSTSVKTTTRTGEIFQSKVVAGASLVKHRPLFSYDSKYLFVITNNVVRVYSTLSGECVHRLCAHEVDVVSVCISPRNHLQLISCDESGKLVYWDYSDGIFHKEIQLASGIRKAFFPTADGPFYVLTSKSRLVEVESANQHSSEWKTIFEGVTQPDHVVIGFKGLFAACLQKNCIKVVFLDELKKQYEHHDHHKQIFTCIIAHPFEYCIATGDNMGRIFVWYNFKKENFSRTVLHWHQLPVADLAFSFAGSNLISGGGECTIVKWKIDSDTRTYVPRLGMPICHIAVSPDNALIASCHVDNAIQFISNTGSISQVIQGLTQGHQWIEFDLPPVPTGMLYDPQTRAIVLNGKPGHLQFYSIQEDKQLFNLDITGFNYQHSERTFRVSGAEVRKAAFDSEGNWLATVELRDDGVTSAEMRLKFWQYSPHKQNFILNTSVEHAHLSEIIAIKFQPVGFAKDHIPLAITCSLDKRFKIWSLADDSDIYKKRQSWNCDSVGYFRELTPSDVGFCDDGTVVAITFSDIVTLWLPESNVLKATLSSPLNQEEIKQVQFGSGSSSHLLVCASKNFLSVWNVLSLTVEWCISLSVCTLSKDCLSEIMAVFTTENILFVFNPSEPKPMCSEKIVSSAPVICSNFIPRNENLSTQTEKPWNATSSLYFINAKQTLFEITDVKTVEAEDDVKKVTMQQKQPLTPFGTLIAQQVKKSEPVSSSQMPSKSSDIIQELIMAPSNTLPPIKIQCASLLGNVFLLPKKNIELQEKMAHEESESDESDNEADPFTFTELKEAVHSTHSTRQIKIPEKEEEVVRQAAEQSFTWLRKVWQTCV